MALEALEAETGPHPATAIIILHGLGADGHDFVPIAQELDLAQLGSVRYVFPHAPSMPVTINGGYVMPAWYDILGTEGVRREDEAGLRRSQALVEDLIARERLGGLVGLSGYLPLAGTIAAERATANADVPIFLAHGRMDPMIPIVRATASRDTLVALGHPVEWHDYPMAHSVCPEEVVDLNRWLLRTLA